MSNDADGTINFDPLSFSKEDRGRTFTYTVREEAGGPDGYVRDETVYTVRVAVAEQADAQGRIGAAVTVEREDGQTVEDDSPVFDNRTEESTPEETTPEQTTQTETTGSEREKTTPPAQSKPDHPHTGDPGDGGIWRVTGPLSLAGLFGAAGLALAGRRRR